MSSNDQGLIEAPDQHHDLKPLIWGLMDTSRSIAEASFAKDTSGALSSSYLFIDDLGCWISALTGNAETELYRVAAQEYSNSLLNLIQGQYRSAFKGLRLSLELVVQGVYLSTRLVERDEWFSSSLDTNWSVLMDFENGPFSKRFTRAFFPELEERSGSYLGLTKTLYRELSETIHGNMPRHIPLPRSLEFSEITFYAWLEKAETARQTLTFCLSMRYLKSLSSEQLRLVEPGVSNQIGHIEPVRVFLGGPATS